MGENEEKVSGEQDSEVSVAISRRLKCLSLSATFWGKLSMWGKQYLSLTFRQSPPGAELAYIMFLHFLLLTLSFLGRGTTIA